MPISIEDKLELREFELHSLLDITRSISTNASEQDLLHIFVFSLMSNKHIARCAIYYQDDNQHYVCKAAKGTTHDYSKVHLPKNFHDIKQDFLIDQQWWGESPFAEFDLGIPILDKDSTLGIILVGKKDKNIDNEAIDTKFLTTVSNVIFVAIENKRFQKREMLQKQIKKQLEIARQVQEMLFPKEKPIDNLPLKVRYTYRPHHLVGGDYYDLIRLDNDRIFFCIADVSGKGVPAAILMSNFQAAIRVLTKRTTDLMEITKELNGLIMQNAMGEHYITGFLCIYDAASGLLEYVNAGHVQPIMFVNKLPDPIMLDQGTTPLGAFQKLNKFELGRVEGLTCFDLFTYTDGVTEIKDQSAQPLGEEGLISFLQARLHADPKEVHADLEAYLNKYKGHQHDLDDLTFVSLHREE